MNANDTKRYRFYGRLPNGSKGMVVALSLPSIQDAYRVLRAHAELTSFVQVLR